METATEREKMIVTRIMDSLEGVSYGEALYALDLAKEELKRRAVVARDKKSRKE